MLDILLTRLRSGRVTEDYPRHREESSTARGRPTLAPARCDGLARCAEVCPAGALAVQPLEGEVVRWQVDLARCVFCGLCAEACPNQAIVMSGDFELAARRRADLVLTVAHRPGRQADGLSEPMCEPDAGSTLAPGGTASPPSGGEPAGAGVRKRWRRSLHVRHLDAGSDNSCDWEIAALLNPVYDIQRLGIDFVASPRHADLLLVTGAVTRHLEPALHAAYEAMPAPRLVVAAGNEACGGGVLQGAYGVAGGVDRCLPVDVYIPGDPPRPRALIQGLLVALGRLEPRLPREVARGESGARLG